MTQHREVHVELLLGRKVFDATGERLGPIEEIICEKDGDEWVVKEYELGPAALFHRLSARLIGSFILNFLGAKGLAGYIVPWDKMDLSDPEKPCLNCHRDKLKKLHH